MRKILSVILMAAVFCVIFSCKTRTDIDYLQNIEQTAIDASVQSSNFTIQPGDMLMISVTAKDNEVAKPFNQNYSSSDISQYSIPSNNLPMQAQSSISGPTYIVDSKGNIQFPILGELSTNGKTIEQFRDDIKDRLTKYIKNPGVNIRTTNFKITVLGEVNKPGAYVIPDGQSMSVLGALALAGDLTIYGQRKNVLVIRNVDGVTSKAYLDLTDANIINSPYYYVKQNDAIYVTPNNTKKNSSSYGPQTGIFISIASVVVGLLALIFR